MRGNRPGSLIPHRAVRVPVAQISEELQAIYNDDVKALDQLLTAGLDANRVNEMGNTLP